VITLSGETEMTTVAQLSELVTGQLSDGTRHLTIDASGLSFADSASVRVLLLAARTLQQRGGGLVLPRPQTGQRRLRALHAVLRGGQRCLTAPWSGLVPRLAHPSPSRWHRPR
jgi:anti-anti-sigma factor